MVPDSPGGSLFDRIGGKALHAVLVDFYDRVFSDAMIGYQFEGKNRHRLVQKEWELIAALLGGGVPYTGRSMAAPHAKVRIAAGHFDRRMTILEETLADHVVDPDVRERWLSHGRALRAQLTSDPDQSCGPGEEPQ